MLTFEDTDYWQKYARNYSFWNEWLRKQGNWLFTLVIHFFAGEGWGND
jgi:hypothetical protein